MRPQSQPHDDPPLVRARRPETAARPSPITTGSWWRLALGGALALALALGLLDLFQLIARPLALLFAAVVIAEALAPIVDRLARWMKRQYAIVLVYLALALMVGLLLWLVVPILIAQCRAFLAAVPALTERIRSTIARFDPAPDGGGNLTDRLVGFAGASTISSRGCR